MRDQRLTDRQLGATLARNLKKAIKEKGIEQKELAEACGTEQASISRYVNNKQYPNGIMLVRLARALDTTVEQLTS